VESKYTPAEIETKWQKAWVDQGLDQAEDNADMPKFYALSMFPYPSGTCTWGMSATTPSPT
jgi:leucyl-tRNA synthetase